MLLELKRFEISANSKATIGNLFIDATWECFTLEDRVRPEGEKVPEETAIPAGSYQVVIDFSERFQRPMPHLLNVPLFTGIRIHPGSTDLDTEGCVLVGKLHPSHRDFLGSSRPALRSVMLKLEGALGLLRVPEAGLPFRYEDARWIYRQQNPPEDVKITITNDFFVPFTTSAG